MRQVVEAANRHGKLAAIQPGSLEQAAEWRAMGFHFMSWKTDIALYREALRKEIGDLRKLYQNVC
jgi:2-keto-3-deoxy-L-rhamnonate aldolase RhmA